MHTGFAMAFAISSTVLTLSGSGYAQALSTQADTQAQVRAAIEASNKKYVEAVLKGDAATIASLYTPDALNFNENEEPTKGRAAIEKLWQRLLSSGVSAVTFNTTEVESGGDLADEVGTFEVKNMSGEVVQRGNYCTVWKRINGQWLLHRDISTSLPVKRH